MRDYIFVKGAVKTFFTTDSLSAAYGMLRKAFGTDDGWTWKGTE